MKVERKKKIWFENSSRYLTKNNKRDKVVGKKLNLDDGVIYIAFEDKLGLEK